MMTSAFKNPTYQHMVNSSSNSKFYALQSDLVNQSIGEFKTSNRSRYSSNLMKRMSPEVWAQLCYDNSLTRNINWSKILEDFLPRNQDDTDHGHGPNPQRKQRYKPVVLRNKTPFVQLNQDPVGAESNSSTRLSKAYTLPHNRDSDVPESQPTGDSSINNFVEMRDIVSPFYHRVLNIDLQFSLRMFMSYIQDFNRLFLGSGPVQQLNNVLNFLYDFFMSITMGLRQAGPRIQRVILNRYSYLNIFNGYSMPLSLHVVESNPSSSNAVSNEQRLSRSTIVSYGQYCCPELRNVLSESENMT